MPIWHIQCTGHNQEFIIYYEVLAQPTVNIKKHFLLPGIQCVNVIWPSGTRTHCVLCQAEHCKQILIKALQDGNHYYHKYNYYIYHYLLNTTTLRDKTTSSTHLLHHEIERCQYSCCPSTISLHARHLRL